MNCCPHKLPKWEDVNVSLKEVLPTPRPSHFSWAASPGRWNPSVSKQQSLTLQCLISPPHPTHTRLSLESPLYTLNIYRMPLILIVCPNVRKHCNSSSSIKLQASITSFFMPSCAVHMLLLPADWECFMLMPSFHCPWQECRPQLRETLGPIVYKKSNISVLISTNVSQSITISGVFILMEWYTWGTPSGGQRIGPVKVPICGFTI